MRLDQARVATAQADVPWLKLKLLPATAVDEVRTTKAEMGERVARASAPRGCRVASAPDAPAAARVKIDALRLAGQQDAARGLVAKVIAQASQPETAYVLAALDLAEPEPLWTTVLERLRLAAAGEGAAGRARAALVYSLAKSGDAAGSRAELAKLDALARAYPLSPDLHALVDRAPSKAIARRGVRGRSRRGVPRLRRRSARTPPSAPAPSAAAAPAAAGDGIPGDSRSAMQVASQAFKKGDYRAGPADLRGHRRAQPERLRGRRRAGRRGPRPGRHRGRDRRATSAPSPSTPRTCRRCSGSPTRSGPAVTGPGRTRGYGDIADRFPEGTYPAYVKQRIEGRRRRPPRPPAPRARAPAPSAASDESSP